MDDALRRAVESPVLHLDGFDGPMDLLLDLAERQRIDLGRLSILHLTEQFLAALERHVPLERRADWLAIAARLVLLRSRLLHPADAPQAAEDADRTMAGLRQLALVRAATAWLAARPLLGHDVFTRPAAGRSPRVLSYMALLEACLIVLQGLDARPAAESPSVPWLTATAFSMETALARIRALLGERRSIPLAACLPAMPPGDPRREQKARAALACSFVAALEIVRQGGASAEQESRMAPITLEGRQPDAPSHW